MRHQRESGFDIDKLFMTACQRDALLGLDAFFAAYERMLRLATLKIMQNIVPR